MHKGVFVDHPGHDLRVRIDVRRWDIDVYADVMPNLPDISARETLYFALRHLARIANNAALAAPERNIDERAFPRHPRCQCAYRIDRFIRMKANPTFGWAARIVILHAETLKDLDRTVVHLDRQGHVDLAQRPTQQFMNCRVELENRRRLIELLLSDAKRIILRIRTGSDRMKVG